MGGIAVSEITATARLYRNEDDYEGVDGTVTFNTNTGAMVLSESAMYVSVDDQEAFQQAVQAYFDFTDVFPDNPDDAKAVYAGDTSIGYLLIRVMQAIEAPPTMGIAVLSELSDEGEYVAWSGFTLEPAAPEVRGAGAPCALGLRHLGLESTIVNLEDRVAALEGTGENFAVSEHRMKLADATCTRVYVAARFVGRVTNVFTASAKTRKPVTATRLDDPADIDWKDLGNTGLAVEYTSEIGYFYTQRGSNQSIGTRTRVDATVVGVLYARADFTPNVERDLAPYAVVPVTLVYGDGNHAWYDMQYYPYLQSNTDIEIQVNGDRYYAYVQFEWPEKMFISTDYEGIHLDTSRGGSTGRDMESMTQYLYMEVADADGIGEGDEIVIDLVTGSTDFDLVVNLNHRMVVDARYPLQAEDGRYEAGGTPTEPDNSLH